MYEYHTNRENRRKVRQWAKDTGYPIPGNSTVTRAMMDAYNTANNEQFEFFSDTVHPKSAAKRNKSASVQKSKPDFFFTGKRPTRPVPVEPTSNAEKKAKYLGKQPTRPTAAEPISDTEEE